MRDLTVVKIGGRAASEQARILELGREIRQLEESASSTGGGRGLQRSYLIVHGGGSELSTLMERYGYTPRFSDGIRQT